MWNEEDQPFFTRILQHAEPIEQCVQQSLNYKIELAESMNAVQITEQEGDNAYSTLFIPIGTYFLEEQRFEWYSSQVPKMFLQHMKKHYHMRELFGAYTKTIRKLYKLRYRLPEEYRNVPGYFLAMMNPGFRLVRFQNEEKTFHFWGLAKIDSIPYTFDFTEFILSL